jgi:hypothetical protein
MATNARSVEAARPRALGVGWRIALVVIGFGVASAGWALIMTGLLAFIGLPLFVVGLALMQSAERP